MLDTDRISRLIQDIEEVLRVISEIVKVDLDHFIADARSRYALRYAIIELVESSSTLGLYLLREGLGVERVESYFDIFDRLAENGVISNAVREGMKRLVRLRNLIVHRYWEVDDARIYREARGGGVRIVERLVEEVESYVSRARGV